MRALSGAGARSGAWYGLTTFGSTFVTHPSVRWGVGRCTPSTNREKELPPTRTVPQKSSGSSVRGTIRNLPTPNSIRRRVSSHDTTSGAGCTTGGPNTGSGSVGSGTSGAYSCGGAPTQRRPARSRLRSSLSVCGSGASVAAVFFGADVLVCMVASWASAADATS